MWTINHNKEDIQHIFHGLMGEKCTQLSVWGDISPKNIHNTP